MSKSPNLFPPKPGAKIGQTLRIRLPGYFVKDSIDMRRLTEYKLEPDQLPPPKAGDLLQVAGYYPDLAQVTRRIDFSKSYYQERIEVLETLNTLQAEKIKVLELALQLVKDKIAQPQSSTNSPPRRSVSESLARALSLPNLPDQYGK